MDKNKCPILIFSKNFCKFFCCFFDVTEKREYNYYFCDKYTYGNNQFIYVSPIFNPNKYRIIISPKFILCQL